jgi:sulfide:quinone oxidoreductase
MKYLSEDFAIGPQVSRDDIAQIKTQGFATVICLRPDHEETGQLSFEELSDLGQPSGLEVHHVPVIPGKMTKGDTENFRAIFAEAPKPVFAYCKSGGRAKSIWESL